MYTKHSNKELLPIINKVIRDKLDYLAMYECVDTKEIKILEELEGEEIVAHVLTQYDDIKIHM